jgi:1-acyl-sn-glycerol-3-phosphate acyltransferase
MIWIRSFLFNVLFFFGFAFYFTILWPFVKFGSTERCWKIQNGFIHFVIWLLKWCVGLEHRVEGLEILQNQLQQGPCLIASLHQSFWETIVLALYVPRKVIVTKKELFQIPVFGTFLQSAQAIKIDRSRGLGALKQLLKTGKDRIQKGSSIVIFPQGTRMKPGDPVQIQGGIGALYHAVQVPVIPVLLDSGHYWGRRQFLKKPGVITLRFLPPIPAGLATAECIKTLQAQLEKPID